MPVLTRFPGGGGSAGYIYQTGNIINPRWTPGTDNSQISLQWKDPDAVLINGKTRADWKGTVVVCKRDSPPKSADDGEIVCESTVKNQYDAEALITDVGGVGCYYGIFPYTKDYVVNVDERNIILCTFPSLEAASWEEIAQMSANGNAKKFWNIGDEKEITLTGTYAGTHTVWIAGFDIDDLTGGGKAGITFAFKNSVGTVTREDSNQWYYSAALRTKHILNVKNGLPPELQNVIKTVDKLTNYFSSSSNSHPTSKQTTQDTLFIPAVCEIMDVSSKTPYFADEGTKYPIYNELSNFPSTFFLRTGNNSTTTWYTANKLPTYLDINARGSSDTSKTYGLLPLFCI